MGILRDTAPRRAIRQAFEGAGRPLSAQEVYVLARVLHPPLGIATVYRTITYLLEEGWLTLVAVPRGGAYYELAGQAAHHHFLCERCGRVFCTRCMPENVETLTPEGFGLSHHVVFLYGECRQCRETGGPAAPPRTG